MLTGRGNTVPNPIDRCSDANDWRHLGLGVVAKLSKG